MIDGLKVYKQQRFALKFGFEVEKVMLEELGEMFYYYGDTTSGCGEDVIKTHLMCQIAANVLGLDIISGDLPTGPLVGCSANTEQKAIFTAPTNGYGTMAQVNYQPICARPSKQGLRFVATDLGTSHFKCTNENSATPTSAADAISCIESCAGCFAVTYHVSTSDCFVFANQLACGDMKKVQDANDVHTYMVKDDPLERLMYTTPGAQVLTLPPHIHIFAHDTHSKQALRKHACARARARVKKKSTFEQQTFVCFRAPRNSMP